MSAFDGIPAAPADAIFGVTALYNACTRERKELLAVGVYRDADGLPYTFPSVAKAEDLIIHKFSKEYLPMTGYRPFLNRARSLLWTDDLLAAMGSRIATIQTCAGTGALYVLCQLTKTFMKIPKVLLADPTWPNHRVIFIEQGGHESGLYPYLKDGVLDIEGTLAALRAAPDGCVVVLQVCANNPTGVDPTLEQWDRIFEVLVAKRHLALFDFAYMGFGSGDIDIDAEPVRRYARSGQEFFVAFSFSKVMGLYGERIGCAHIVTKDPAAVPILEGRMARIARGAWSVCPQNGCLIVDTVLSDPALRAQWEGEVKAAGKRVIDIRNRLCDLLEQKTGRAWPIVRQAKGFFGFSGLTPDQVKRLAQEWGVFLPASGRITFPSLNPKNVEYVADAIAAIVKST
jgi:aspartate/tyrosine/aromatic aminotransferase